MTTEGASLVSLVIPLFDEAANAEALAEHLTAIASANPEHVFEVVAVDDGSTDNTIAILQAALDDRLPLTTVQLSRNFGSHYAISAGLANALGEAAVVLGADLQEPSELVGLFLAAWHDGAEVVWGIRRSRTQRGLGSTSSRIFSRLLHRYSEIVSYPAEGPSGVLVARPVIDAVNRLKERHRNVLGLIAWVGFTQTEVEYDQLPRLAGTTKWTTAKLLKLGLDSFVQFSHTPIRLAALLGVLISGLGFAYAAFISIRAILGAEPPEGWTTVIVLVLLLGGIQLIVLAIFGEYLWRATDEARDRPVYVVRRVEIGRLDYDARQPGSNDDSG